MMHRQIQNLALIVFLALSVSDIAQAQPAAGITPVINSIDIVQALRGAGIENVTALFNSGNVVTVAQTARRIDGTTHHTIIVQQCALPGCAGRGGGRLDIVQSPNNRPGLYPPFEYTAQFSLLRAHRPPPRH